jgi:hypothetical protein
VSVGDHFAVGAHRDRILVAGGKINRWPSRLEEIGIEHQLQLAPRFPLGLPVLGLKVFGIGDRSAHYDNTWRVDAKVFISRMFCPQQLL